MDVTDRFQNELYTYGNNKNTIKKITPVLKKEKAGKPDLFFTIHLCNFTLTEITVIRKVRPG